MPSNNYGRNTPRAAKDELVRLGSASIDPLLSLLNGLLDDPESPHFASGREAEGARAWGTSGEYIDHPEELEITWRLINDFCDIVGRLKAIEAVPSLLRIIEARPITGLEHITGETLALERIGKPALPIVLDRLLSAAREESLMMQAPDTSPLGQARLSELVKFERRLGIVLSLIGDQSIVPALEGIADFHQAPRASAYARNVIEKVKLVKD
jgi:hypothetical protein